MQQRGSDVKAFFDRIWDKLVRWRTWVVNLIFGVIITPDVVLVLLGFDWGVIVPPKFMPYVTLATVILNIWMRPREAVRKGDLEAGP